MRGNIEKEAWTYDVNESFVDRVVGTWFGAGQNSAEKKEINGPRGFRHGFSVAASLRIYVAITNLRTVKQPSVHTDGCFCVSNFSTAMSASMICCRSSASKGSVSCLTQWVSPLRSVYCAFIRIPPTKEYAA